MSGFLNATLLNNLQGTNTTSEKRFSEVGLVDAAYQAGKSIDFIAPEQQAELSRISAQRQVQIPVMKDMQVEVRTEPGFSIPANLEETEFYYFQPYDVFSGLRHIPAAYANNVVSSEFAIKEKLKQIDYAMARKQEEILASILELRKTQLLNYTSQVSHDGNISFNAVTDTLEIDLNAQKSTMFFALEHLMEANDLGGAYRVVTSRAGLVRQRAEILKYGAGNEKNIANLGIYPLDRLHESSGISAGSDIFNGYLLRDGAIGVISNHPYDFVNGTVKGEKRWSVSDVEMPFSKMRSNIFVNSEATDATSLINPVNGVSDSNLRMTHFEEMGLWNRFFVVYRYNSNLATRPNDIVKIKGLTTNI